MSSATTTTSVGDGGRTDQCFQRGQVTFQNKVNSVKAEVMEDDGSGAGSAGEGDVTSLPPAHDDASQGLSTRRAP